jgi:hypothetical protein
MLSARAASVLVSLAACAPAAADVVYETPGPFGGWFGLWGPTVSSSQIVGARFVPTANYTLSAIRIWFMNDSATPGAPIRITLRADGTHADGSSIPGTQVIAEWNIECQTGGWNPVQHSVTSAGGIALRAGVRYWVVAQSDEPGGFSPVWNFASVGSGWKSIGLRTATSEGWQSGGGGAALTLMVEGSPGLPPANPDLNQDGVVNGDDLGILLGAWGPCAPNGPCSADLDGNGTVDADDLGRLLAAWST